MLRMEPREKIEYYSVNKNDRTATPDRKPQVKAPTAILELVDGPKDMRFAMTALTVARERQRGKDVVHGLTRLNVKKVTQFRKNGVEALESAISKLNISKKAEKKE